MNIQWIIKTLIWALKKAHAYQDRKINTAINARVLLHTAPGVWDYDPYNLGMANGMLTIKALLDGKQPELLEVPKEYGYQADNRRRMKLADGYMRKIYIKKLLCEDCIEVIKAKGAYPDKFNVWYPCDTGHKIHELILVGYENLKEEFGDLKLLDYDRDEEVMTEACDCCTQYKTLIEVTCSVEEQKS